MNVLLASTSSLFGGKYLEYIKEEIAELFSGIDEIIFIPFARPSGISHEEYTQIARDFFEQINIKVKGLHEFEDKIKNEHQVLEVVSMSGTYDYMIKVIAKDINDYNNFMTRIVANIPNVGQYHSAIVLSVVKDETKVTLG